MLYQSDEAPSSNLLFLVVSSLLPIPVMASDNTVAPLPSPMEEVPPDPPPPTALIIHPSVGPSRIMPVINADTSIGATATDQDHSAQSDFARRLPQAAT